MSQRTFSKDHVQQPAKLMFRGWRQHGRTAAERLSSRGCSANGTEGGACQRRACKAQSTCHLSRLALVTGLAYDRTAI
eukprot:4823104-Amphidinium_carterae.1